MKAKNLKVGDSLYCKHLKRYCEITHVSDVSNLIHVFFMTQQGEHQMVFNYTDDVSVLMDKE